MNSFKNTIVIILVFFACSVNAQDFPYHYFTHINPLLNNPSFASFNNKMEANVVSHNLWAGGFKPANDYAISVSFAPDRKKKGKRNRYQPDVGLGITLQKDQIGPFNQNILQLIYAYHIPINSTTILSLGLSGMIENINIDVNSLSPIEGGDPRLAAGNNNAFMIDGGFGATVHGEKYEVSVSVINLSPGVYSFDDASVADIENYRKYYFAANYSFQLNDKMHFVPKITLRNSRLQTFNYDTSFSFDFAHLLLGMGYRSENALFFYAEIPVRKFVFSYTSENALNSKPMVGNAHTFSIGWKIN